MKNKTDFQVIFHILNIIFIIGLISLGEACISYWTLMPQLKKDSKIRWVNSGAYLPLSQKTGLAHIFPKIYLIPHWIHINSLIFTIFAPIYSLMTKSTPDVLTCFVFKSFPEAFISHLFFKNSFTLGGGNAPPPYQTFPPFGSDAPSHWLACTWIFT